MNKIEEMIRVKKVSEMVKYMASEVVFNMKKIILQATRTEDKYAIAYDLLIKTLEIRISLYNTETKTTVHKCYHVHDFSRICSSIIILEDTFNKLTYDMLEKSDKKEQEIYL